MPIHDVPQSIYVYKATNIRVIDGDTIEADIDLGFKMRWKTVIRFSDIDVYESRGAQAHPLGKAAAEFLEGLMNEFGPTFYFKSDRDQVAIYNRAGGAAYLETQQKKKTVFIDVTATLKANGFEKSGAVARPSSRVLVTRAAKDITELFR